MLNPFSIANGAFKLLEKYNDSKEKEIENLIAHNNLEEALVAVEKITLSNERKVKSLSIIADLLARKGKTREAKSIFEKATQLAKDSLFKIDKMDLLGFNAYHMSKSGFTDESKLIFNDVIDMINADDEMDRKIKATSNLAAFLSYSFESSSVLFFNKVLKSVDEISEKIEDDFKDKMEYYQNIIGNLLFAGMYDKAITVIEKIKNKKIENVNYIFDCAKSNCYIQIAECFINVGKRDEALLCYNKAKALLIGSDSEMEAYMLYHLVLSMINSNFKEEANFIMSKLGMTIENIKMAIQQFERKVDRESKFDWFRFYPGPSS